MAVLLKIKTMCLTDYIGIRGECKNAKIYIDDLPGINIENAADIAEGFERPLEVVRKAFTLAVDQVFNDWINQVKDYFDYREILGTINYKNSGVDCQYGGANEDANLTIERLTGDFIKTSWKSIGFYSENAVTRQITVKDRFNQILYDESHDIKAGYNKIDLSLESDSDSLTLTMNLDGLTIGAYEVPFTREFERSSRCGYCVSFCGCLTTYLDKPIGVDIEASCVADRCAIIAYFLQALKVPLLYKTGINYFMAVKGTSRVNAYTRNSMDQVNFFLNQWQGGVDMVSGIKTNSAYWQSLKVAADSTVTSLKTMKIKPFSYNATEVINVLP